MTDGVERALGRAPRDFKDYARDAAATGVWRPAPERRWPMIDGYARLLTLIAAAGAGLAAGFYFTFSTVVMRALDRLPKSEAVSAMQSMNKTAPAPWVVACLSIGLVCVALSVVGFRQPDEPWSVYLLVGSALYLASIVLTFAFHIPRNDNLDLVDPASAGAADAWSNFYTSWTAGNHVRTVTSLAGAILFAVALVTSRRSEATSTTTHPVSRATPRQPELAGSGVPR